MHKDFNISNFLIFPDQEAASVGPFFIDWVKENEDNLTVMDGLKIGLACSEFQYNMRVLRSRINGDKKLGRGVVDLNNKHIDIIESYPEMIKFALEKYQEMISMMPIEVKFGNMHNFITPSYSFTEEVKQEFRDSIRKIRFKNGKWK